MLPHPLAFSLLLLLSPLALSQTAGPAPTLVYTYDGQSVDPSILSAISTAGAPAAALGQSSGSDTATGLVSPFPTTATVGPTSAPGVTSNFAFSSAAPGEVLSSNTRPPYTASGTINTSMSPSAAATSAKSGAIRSVGLSWGGGMGVSMVLLGVVAGGMMML